MMSIMTTSPRLASAKYMAADAPTFPAPMTAILRFIKPPKFVSSVVCHASEGWHPVLLCPIFAFANTFHISQGRRSIGSQKAKSKGEFLEGG